MTVEVSLRERKKLATRAALSHAAWTLMVEQGLDAATPEAIAEAADVSPRTFRNYFVSREEAILAGLVRQGTSLIDAMQARPSDEPLWDSLTQILPSFVDSFIGERDDIAVLMRVVGDNPGMRAQHLVTYERVNLQLAELIAERTGTDAERDMAPRLLASVLAAVLRTSVEIWAKGQTDRALTDLVRDGLAQVRDGLPILAPHPPLHSPAIR
ncbi:TetR/AcrR family transcriptional regulator [Streptomyces sp. NPDC051677]|uniref:TetR/AcrR family transcriptional regulator n=1 Tax=Streptomyces sp. NPDC051677 TaxID=3365669 RepID=UPI0037D8331F